jgi:outer membrane protein assembly factor BamB
LKTKTALAPILIAMIIGGLLVSMVSGQTNGQSGWTMLGADPSHTGYVTSGMLITPNLLWSYPTTGALTGGGASSPAVANGILYIGSANGNLYALNATDGIKLWNYSTGGSVASSPAVANGIVYVGSLGGGFYALNATNGEKIWSFTTDRINSSPTIVDGVVYFAGSHTVYAFNANSGLMLWNYSVNVQFVPLDPEGIYSSPAVVNGVVYIGSNNGLAGYLYALNATDGVKLWVYTTEGWVESPPTVGNGIVYIPADRNLYALNASNGQKVWTYSNMLSTYAGSSVALANGAIYVLSGSNGAIKALNAKTGVQLWSSSTTFCGPFPIVVGDVLYVGGINNLFAFNVTDGSWLWNSNQTGEILSSPAYANGVVYAQSTKGTIYAFGTPSAQPTSSPTPNVPEFPALVIVPLLLSMLSVAVIIRHRKTANLNQ